MQACQKHTGIDAVQGKKLSLSFEGPETNETDIDNPFLNYRLDVIFSRGDKTLTIIKLHLTL